MADADRKDMTQTGKWMAAVVLIASLAVLMVEMGVLDFSIFKAPEVTNMIYDRVTLPQSLHFITGFKSLFQVLVVMVCCVPAASLLYGTERVMAKYGKHYQD